MVSIAVERSVEMISRNISASSFFNAMRACCLATSLLYSCSIGAVGTLEKIAESGAFVLGFRSSSMPFSYLDGDRRPIGYAIDICMKVVEAVRRELERPDIIVKYAEVNSATNVNMLNAAEIDLECGSSAITEEQLKVVSFSIPTFISTLRLMVQEGSGIKSISNLAGKTVVTTKGTSSERVFSELNQLRSLSANLTLAKSHVDSFSILDAGKADAFVMDDVLIYSFRASSKEPAKFAITRDSLSHKAMALMMRREDPAFKAIVDAELTSLIIHGELKTIYRKWFESPIPPSQLNIGLPPSYMMKEHFKAPSEWQIYSSLP
jgi:glutamate/aspartate transport system substrate-binding protein